MTLKRILTLLCVLAGIATAQGQTLEECRRLAREHYPTIRQYDLLAQTEQYNLSNAARAWIPQVLVSSQATYQSATPTYPDALANMLKAQGLEVAGVRKDQYKVAVDVSQHIWDGGQSKALRETVRAEANEQRRAADVDLYALEERVDNLYFGILLLGERMAQTENQIGVLQSVLDRMRAYCRNGVAMQADADAVEAELLTAQQALQQAQVSQTNYRRMLEIFIGQPLAEGALARPALCPRPEGVPARPELDLFDARIGLLVAREKSVNSSVMPRFSAFAQGFYGYPGWDMFKSMTSADWKLNGLVGVRMSWNVGAFWTKKNSLENLRTAREQVEVQRDIFLFNTQLRSTQEEGEVERLRHAVVADEHIAELRRSVRMAAESQLANGVIDTTDLLRKIADETAAMLQKNTHEIELLQATYQLKHTLNQ